MRTTTWGFDLKDRDMRVRPQDDFYHYAGGGWLARNPIPANESRWGAFVILRYETEKRLQKLLKSLAAKKRCSLGSPEQMVRDFYRSGVDLRTRTRLGLRPIEMYLKKIRNIRTTDDLLGCIAELHTIGIDVAWGADVDQDMKDSTKNILYIGQGGLGLPDRDYYLKNDAESRRVRDAYRLHMTAMLQHIGMSKTEAQSASQAVWTLEKRLAEASMPKEDAREVEKIYHKKSLTQLIRLAPHIDWKTYFSRIGAGTPRVLIVCQPDFFAAVSKSLVEVPLDEWRAYLTWHVVSSFASFLTPTLGRRHFKFYGTVIAGTKQMRPLWRRVLGVVNGGLGEILGEVYVKAYFSPETKKCAEIMVDDLFTAYEARLKHLDWMSARTKKKAVEKLKSIVHKIGYPDRWKSYRGLSIDPHDYVGNVVRTSRFEHRRAMKKLGKSVDRAEWFMSPQSVNAYYSFGLNDIVFPAAILQAPFFDPAADDAINYGAMGMVIGHEMTHGFDDQGSKFDGKGNMQNWWTPEDRKRFEKKTKPLIKQFNAYTVADGVSVNGKLTLGENVADLGGLSIALDAYKLCLARTGRRDIDGFTPEQRFFLGYSLFERENIRPELEKMFAINDPHAPAITRINGPLSNMPEFYEAFGVKKGDKLYRAPNNRVKIW